MLLETDVQTLDDLRIFRKRDTPGIFEMYNHTHTRGGEDLLRDMFRSPLSDKGQIQHRADLLSNISASGLTFPFDGALFDTAEKYIRNQSGDHEQTLNEQDIHNGVTAVIRLMHQIRAFIHTPEMQEMPAFEQERNLLLSILEAPAFTPVFEAAPEGKVPYAAMAAFDRLFRQKQSQDITQLMGHIYLIDAYLSVATTVRRRKFVFPLVLEKGSRRLSIQGVYHPELETPVANDINMIGDTSLVFLTGANMAGKSTFLRSIGTAVYLAHMGFPVPARAMEFSVMDGLYTTINLPDNLGIGASHFYAEVLRVKQIANELHKGKNILVIFDELFRGTNVKDAQEATEAVAQGFAKRSKSRFIVSSHIVEAAEHLKKQPGVDFLYLPTRMQGHTPEYTYKLEPGVTDDRHGMLIIRNEGILDILKNGKKRADRTTHTQKNDDGIYDR